MTEQGLGVYADQLAQLGFVSLAFDPSYKGESDGEPRHVTSPEIFAEDFSAGVDFLGTLPHVDRDRIGSLGICGSRGFALNAATVDPRIKAVITSALVDISQLLAALLTVEGIEASVVHGACLLVQGPTSDGRSPCGLGNPSASRVAGGHSWAEVPGFGTLDISPRVNERLASPPYAHWKPLARRGGAIGTAWNQGDLATRVAFVADAHEYEQAVAAATHAVDTATAVYWAVETIRFEPEMLDSGYIQSPLMGMLADAAGPDGHWKLAAHLYAVSRNARRPLAGVSLRKAWRYLSEVGTGEVQDLRSALDAEISRRDS